MPTRPTHRPVQFTSHIQQQAGRPRRSGSAWPAFVFLVIVAGVLGYFGYNAHRSTGDTIAETTKVSQRFLADLNQGDYTGAAAQLSASAKVDNNAQSLQKAMSSLIRIHGALLNSRLDFSEPQTIAGLDTCRLNYRLNFVNGSEHLSLILVRSYEGWKIDSLSFG